MKKQQRGAAIHGGDVRMSLLRPVTQQPQQHLQRQTGATAAFWARGILNVEAELSPGTQARRKLFL